MVIFHGYVSHNQMVPLVLNPWLLALMWLLVSKKALAISARLHCRVLWRMVFVFDSVLFYLWGRLW